MKRIAAIVLVAVMSASCSLFSYARDTNDYKQSTPASHKATRKEQKASNKYSKRQQKAMKKSAKVQRKDLKRARKRGAL